MEAMFHVFSIGCLGTDFGSHLCLVVVPRYGCLVWFVVFVFSGVFVIVVFFLVLMILIFVVFRFLPIVLL
jgi:hypothetical protein